MNLLLQIAVIFGICFLGEGIEMLLPFPLPASIISMLLLFVFLCLGWMKQDKIAKISDFLLKNMAFFFIPAGVSVLEQYPILKGKILPFLAVCFLTTITTFAATVFTVRGVISLQKRGRKDD